MDLKGLYYSFSSEGSRAEGRERGWLPGLRVCSWSSTPSRSSGRQRTDQGSRIQWRRDEVRDRCDEPRASDEMRAENQISASEMESDHALEQTENQTSASEM